MYRLALSLFMLMSLQAVAGNSTCPDLSYLDHANPNQQGWSVSPFSPKTRVSGVHRFNELTITNRKIGGIVNAACSYDDGQLVLYKQGKFSHPSDASLWYHTYEYDQCVAGIEACLFYSF